jgi:threonine/homoserine/homoserine lactone efflux protein
MFLVLGVFAFRAARKQKGEKKALLLNNKLNRFLLGLVMSALNPVQIPFWFLWTSTFIQTKVLPVEPFLLTCSLLAQVQEPYADSAFTYMAVTGSLQK